MVARVTIAIPCYKQAVFLFECLNSLIAQTIVDWEAFVVDDCSPDSSAAEIVASYDDKRIRCVRHQENRGLAAARNTAIRAGSASNILCLDADDFLHPEFLFATLNAMERQNADCAFADFQCVGIENVVWTSGVKTPDELARSQWVPGAGTIMRRSLWERVGGYCEATELRGGNEDWDFWIGAATLGFSAAHVPRPLYLYRRRASSMSNSVLAPIDWKTREFISKRHQKFFSCGDRAKVFRTGGLLRSASAQQAAKRRLAALLLVSRAVTIDPMILITGLKSFLGRRYRLVRSAVRKTITRFNNFARKLTAADQGGEVADDAPQNWEAVAPNVHHRSGHLSHDYPVLSDVIKKTGVQSVLEIGCGSGRLIPVYLLHGLSPIWVQDISTCALEICRRRFFHQKQIQFFAGDLEDMTLPSSVDLVVSTRVLQHILDEDNFMRKLNHLAKGARFFFINETTIGDNIRDPNIKGRDYGSIFQSLGFDLRHQGELEAEGGRRQSWKLFEKLDRHPENKNQKFDKPIFVEQRLAL